MRIEIAPHPSLRCGLFEATWEASLDGLPSSPDNWFEESRSAPVERNEEIRQAVRRMLRHGGYKPTGRGKPSSEYLVKAVSEGKLGSINPAVDCGNVVSWRSGLPISVVDADRFSGDGRIAIAEPGTTYVFNPSGQVIDVSGLVCLFDQEGPAANAVKDAQRTKTDGKTQRILAVVWGLSQAPDHTDKTLLFLEECLSSQGATVARIQSDDPEGA